MKRKLGTLLFLIGYLTASIAQSTQKDSFELKKLNDSAVAYLYNADKATVFIELSKKRSKELHNWFYFINAHSHELNLSIRSTKTTIAEYQLKNYEQLVCTYKNQLSLSEFDYLEDFIKVHKFNLFRKLYRYEAAINLLKTDVEKLKLIAHLSQSQLKQLYFDYHNLAFLLNAIGSINKSAEYEEKALSIFNLFGANNYAYKILPLTFLGHLYSQLGDTLKKKYFYEQAFLSYEIARKKEPNITSWDGNAIDLLTNLFEQAINTNDLQKAQNIVQQISQLKQKNSFKDFTTANFEGRIALKKQDIQAAKRCFYKALNDCDMALEKKPKAVIYLNLARLNTNEFNLQTALQNVQNALMSISYQFNYTDFKANPSVSDVRSKKELLNIINLKSDILLQLAQSNPDNYLQTAFETAQLGINLMDSIRVDYSSDYDKINLVSNAYPIFEKYIKSAYLLHQKTQNSNYIVAAYQAVEQSKALVLLEGLKGIEAETVLSEADRQSLFQLKADLIALEKKRNDEKNQDLSNANYIKIQNQIFDKNNQFDNLIKTFETRYPAYYKLKFDRQLTNIKQTQDMLTANQTLVNYFVGDSSIFVFLIKSNTQELIEIKKDFPLDNWVKLLRGSLSADNYQNQADIYADMAFKLYEKLIKPIKTQLTEEITLIPDGILGYIPFEALLTHAPEKAVRFQTHAYLLREHSINYSFSATLLREMINKKHAIKPNKNIITYAPFFNGNTRQLDSIYTNDLAMRRDFAPLSNSGEEAYSIAKLMGGEALIGKEATDSSFIKNAPTARMLLLATHGKANDKSSDYSYLAFASQNDSLKNALFYVRDLYNLTLNADLVVLSACETGIGKLQRGEGIISLARAFAYAGAKSIVTSLWSVNDAKTKDLMLFFYKNLKKGKSKDAALREAKLSLMRQKDHPNAHPFFWAGFIGIGDMAKIR